MFIFVLLRIEEKTWFKVFVLLNDISCNITLMLTNIVQNGGTLF